MANETDTPGGGVSNEGVQPSVESPGELSFGLDQSQALSEQSYTPPWLRMDPELTRAVLAKTEEELLGSLSALMRNKIENEKAQRVLARVMLDIEEAKKEVAGVKRQVSIAEDELNTRLSDHSRVIDEISRAQYQLQTDRRKYLQCQDELVTIKNEIEEARSQTAVAAAQLAELQLQHRSLRDEIESAKTEVADLHEKRQAGLQQLEPIRKELDERLAAREALIQEVTVMDRHLAELTSTRDIRTNAQRIALVGRGTESMRGEIQQMKEEIERIDKERIRLASERDRVESEFAGLESRLSTARFSYAETLERLDEARTALATTEKEHDEAVSKLVEIQEREPKPEPVVEKEREDTVSGRVEIREPATPPVVEQEHEEAGSKVVEIREPSPLPVAEKGQAISKLVEIRDPAPLPLVEKQQEEEAVVRSALQEPKPLPVKEEPVEAKDRERDEAFVTQEIVRPEKESALPLLKNEPLPAVTHSWDSYRLESEFFTEETLDGNRVAHLVSELPGIENALVVRQRGAVLGGDLPERLSEQLKTPGRDYELLFKNLPNRTQERQRGDARLATFQVGEEFLTATQADDVFLVVSHEGPKLHPGVEEKLAVVAEELAKMYPLSESGRQESAGAKA